MSTTTTLAELATTRPSASRVFHRLHLDFCCGGHRSIDEACDSQGLNANDVLSAIDTEEQSADASPRWDLRPIADLVAFIVDVYHERLRTELPELIAMAEKVEEKHGDKPTCPRGLAAHLRAIHESVLSHLGKEEQILFPMILRGVGSRVAGPIRVMEEEHEDHGVNLQRTREMTSDLIAPPEACPTWRALYLRLDALERDLMEHIHLENHVLFPRVLGAN